MDELIKALRYCSDEDKICTEQTNCGYYGIGLALSNMGKKLIASDWSKRSMPYSSMEDQMKQDRENNESI